MQKKKSALIKEIISREQNKTSTASYWPCLSKIKASSVEWLKKEGFSSPVLPQIIQLVKSCIELIKLAGSGRHLKERWLWSSEELCISNDNMQPNVKSHFPSFSFHDLLSTLLSSNQKKKLSCNRQQKCECQDIKLNDLNKLKNTAELWHDEMMKLLSVTRYQ